MSAEAKNEGNGKNSNPNQGQGYHLTVPVDISQLEELRNKKPQDLQVVGRLSDGTLVAEEVEVDGGEGWAELKFKKKPKTLGLFVGPKRVPSEELVKSQTITASVSGDRWTETQKVNLEPIPIPSYYWDWWYRWCREFTIRGRLVCPDGSPVPGAEVCAKDIDGWFFWSSTEEIGCDTTDRNGAFEIKFRWCCGFWPRWWWQNRTWRPDPLLVEKVRSAFKQDPGDVLARASAQPSLDVFDKVLEDRPFAAKQSLQELPPEQLEQVRTQLVQQLPDTSQTPPQVWPWVPWQPWLDCAPDIVFEATQAGQIILEEDFEDTRWNISNSQTVNLTASEEALCRGDCQEPPCPEGECLVVTKACSATIDQVGGNLGAPATPEGYLNPGSPTPGTQAHNGDRPFAETVKLFRNVGTLQNVDYLGFEFDDGTGWAPVPTDGVEDFRRRYYDTTAPSSPIGAVPFKFSTVDGHYVVESRAFYESNSGFTWDTPSADRYWLKHRNLLVPIDSKAFPDGTYRFRVIGWEATSGGDSLTNRRVLPLCGEEEEVPVEVVLTFDNRLNPDPSHPAAHPSGSGTVHLPVTEPDTAIETVRINGSEVGPCGVAQQQEGKLKVDFLVHDPVDPSNPTGHLSHYTLIATYGRNQKVNLLNKGSLKSLPSGPGAPFPGPTYGEALGQGASRPNWEGGRYQLTVDLEDAFPEPCCYQLELRAYKRTIVDCHGHHGHRNLSEYTIGYGV